MNRSIPSALVVATATALSSPVLAQDAAAPEFRAATIEACKSLKSDAERLACYDAAAERVVPGPAMADAAAANAKQQQESIKEIENANLEPQDRATKAVNDFFTSESGDDAIANAGKGSMLDSRWELAKDSKLGLFNLRAYKPVYLLPVFWTSSVNAAPTSPNPNNTVMTPLNIDALEAKFQLSFKTKLLENVFGDNGDVWMAYTQSSRWQVYNKEESSPFRETNYEPEVMMVFRTNYELFGWTGRMAGVSLAHQSNGRNDPLSRSWNRVIFNAGFDREDWALNIRPWYRLEEDPSDDNNADIEDYVGRGDATLVHTIGNHELSLTGRHSLRTGDRSHGSLQFDWAFPIYNNLRGHLQVFDGYGESMIDYNHKATYVGLGVSLLEWY